MSTHTVSKKYYIGSTKPGKWSSVYAYKPQTSEIRIRRGEIFAAISLKSDPGFAISTAGNLLIDHLHETYFDNDEDRPIFALEKAVVSTKKYLQKIIEKDVAGAHGIEMDLIAVVVHGLFIYVVSLGAGKLCVYRDGQLTLINEALRDPTGGGEIKTASFMAKSGDVYVLGTPALTDEMMQSELEEIAVDFSEKSLRNKLFEDDSGLALMLIGFDVNRKEAQEEYDAQDEISEVVEEMQDDIHEEIEGEQSENETGEDTTSEDVENEEVNHEFPKVQGYLERKQATGVPFFENLKTKAHGLFTKTKGKINDFRNKRSTVQVTHNQQTPENDEEVNEFVDTNQPTYKVILDKIKLFFIHIGRFFKYTVWEKWLGMGEGSMYLKGKGKNKKWRFLVVLILVLIAILYFSIKSISEHNQQVAIENDAKQNIQQATSLVNEVNDIAPLIAKSSGDDQRRTGLLTKLNDASQLIAKTEGVTVVDTERTALQQKIETLSDLLNKTISVTSPQLVVDIGAFFPGANPTDMAISKGEIFITDGANGKIYKTTYSGKDLKDLVTGLNNPKTLTTDKVGNIVFLDDNGDARLATLNLDSLNVRRHAGTSEFRVGNITQIDYANIFGGRIYGVDKNLKAAVMLQQSGESYSIPDKRFEFEGIENTTDVAVIDLKVYLLGNFKEGIYRSYNNSDDTPKLDGVPGTLTNAKAFAFDNVNIYVADPTNRRIVVLKKDLKTLPFIAQYKASSTDLFTNIKEVAVDTEKGLLFVLDGNKIYQLSLSSLNQF